MHHREIFKFGRSSIGRITLYVLFLLPRLVNKKQAVTAAAAAVIVDANYGIWASRRRTNTGRCGGEALQTVWKLCSDFRIGYLSMVRDCTPICDEICRRALSFIVEDLCSESDTIRFVTEYAVFFE